MLRILIILLFSFGLLACGHDKPEEVSKTNYTVTEKQENQPLYFSGTLAPLSIENVPSPASGFVIEKNFEYGQPVKKGQVLFKIHSEQLQKEYNSALTAYLKAKQELATTHSKLRNDEELFHLGIISKDTYNQSKSNYDSNNVNYLQAVNALKEALKTGPSEFNSITQLKISDSESVDKALKQQYDHIDIVATVSGVALMPTDASTTTNDKTLMMGSKVETGQVLVSIGDLSGLSVTIDISENDVTHISANTPVDITTSAAPNLILRGKVDSVDAQAKPAANYGRNGLPLFGAKIIVPALTPEEFKSVRVGMSAKLAVQLPKVTRLMVPIAAVTQQKGQYYVMKIEKGQEQKIPVVTGVAGPEFVEIQKGLSKNDVILVTKKGVVMSLISLSGIEKHYGEPPHVQKVLHNIDLTIEQGEMIAIVGASGSGKSTLMHLLGLLDKPSQGNYYFEECSLTELDDDAMAKLRNETMGFVFQQFYLLPRLSALENVALPLGYRKLPNKESLAKAKEMLEKVGLGDKLHHRPNQLSGGQQQRVAIARALIGKPTVIFADEPTGALDSATGREIMHLFKMLHEEQGATLIIVTHDASIAAQCQRSIVLKDGCIQSC